MKASPSRIISFLFSFLICLLCLWPTPTSLLSNSLIILLISISLGNSLHLYNISLRSISPLLLLFIVSFSFYNIIPPLAMIQPPNHQIAKCPNLATFPYYFICKNIISNLPTLFINHHAPSTATTFVLTISIFIFK